MKMEEDEGGKNSNFVPRRDEEHLNNMLMHFEEEMKLLEEEVEKFFLFLEEIPEIEEFLFLEKELAVEEVLIEYEYTKIEDDEVERETTTMKKSEEDLINGLKTSVLHGERMLEVSRETHKSHVFKANEWFVSAGVKGCEDRQIHNFSCQ
jgi:hypothetical protein